MRLEVWRIAGCSGGKGGGGPGVLKGVGVVWGARRGLDRARGVCEGPKGVEGVWGLRDRLPTHRLLHHDGDEGGGAGGHRPMQAALGAGPGPGPAEGALGGNGGVTETPPQNQEPPINPPESGPPRNRDPPNWDTPGPGLPLGSPWTQKTPEPSPRTGTPKPPPGSPRPLTATPGPIAPRKRSGDT